MKKTDAVETPEQGQEQEERPGRILQINRYRPETDEPERIGPAQINQLTPEQIDERWRQRLRKPIKGTRSAPLPEEPEEQNQSLLRAPARIVVRQASEEERVLHDMLLALVHLRKSYEVQFESDPELEEFHTALGRAIELLTTRYTNRT